MDQKSSEFQKIEKIKLPVDDHISGIHRAIADGKNIVITAAPGAGKTTRIPPSLFKLTDKKIILLQPRRIAARAIAQRIAEEMDWTLGKEVGYQVRHENRTSAETKLIIMTEALLLKKILVDPELSDVGIVIFDEFHERSLYSDLSLALTKELQLLRDDIKILVMSATLEAHTLAEYLQPSQVFSVEGRLFPIEISYELKPQKLVTDFDFSKRFTEKILQTLKSQKSGHHILCFLPGMSEIRSIEKMLQASINESQVKIIPLHGGLDLKEQDQALVPYSGIKVILSTNVAETSITINNVDTVIDSGLERVLWHDSKKLFPTLKTSRISIASSIQRQGRAGREFPGRCFKVWAKIDENSFEEYQSAAIESDPIEELILYLSYLGIKNIKSFSWFEAPPDESIKRALGKLTRLNLIQNNEITPLGKTIAHWPLPLELAKLLIGCKTDAISNLGALACALLSDRDYYRNTDFSSYSQISNDSDLIVRIKHLSMSGFDIKEIEKNYSQYCRLIDAAPEKNIKLFVNEKSIEILNKILIQIYSDRICKRRRTNENSAVSVFRQGVEINPQSSCRTSEFFIALQGRTLAGESTSLVDIAHPLSKEILTQLLESQISIKKTVELSEKDSGFYQIEKRYLFEMELEEKSRRRLSSEEIGSSLVTLLIENFDDYKEKMNGVMQIEQRLAWAKKVFPDSQWPEWTSSTKESLIEFACSGCRSLNEALEKNWVELFHLLLPQKEKNLFSKELPEKIQVPNGRFHALNWTVDGPELSVKLQECFGWTKTPEVGNGTLKIKLILLGPNMRPLQTTSDLKNFWEKTYFELRGPLRHRYPRQKWPDNPAEFILSSIPVTNNGGSRRN